MPFVFTDKAGATGCSICGVYNGVSYFYSVTAFDVNSIVSGPTSLESSRVTKQVTAGPVATNFDNASSTQAGVFGRKGLLPVTSVPTIDATTGKFSGPFPPSDALTMQLAGFATLVLKGNSAVSMQYDSTVVASFSANSSATLENWFTLGTPTGTSDLSITTTKSATSGNTSVTGGFTAHRGRSHAGKRLWRRHRLHHCGLVYAQAGIPAYFSGIQGRGCANSGLGGASADAGKCYYQGPRWFNGANETKDDPTTVNPLNYAAGAYRRHEL